MTTGKRIACIDCKHCEYKPLSEEEKEEYYQADREFREKLVGLSLDDQESHSRYWKPAHRLIRMKEYTCNHYRTESFDYLSGEVKVSSGIDCDSYRSSVFSNKCGYDAIFFVPKEPLTPPPASETIKTRSYDWFKTFWK